MLLVALMADLDTSLPADESQGILALAQQKFVQRTADMFSHT